MKLKKGIPSLSIKEVTELETFSLRKVYNKLNDLCPMTLASLSAIAKRPKARDPNYLPFKLTASLCILLNEKNLSFNAFQKMMNVIMYKGCLKTEVSPNNFILKQHMYP